MQPPWSPRGFPIGPAEDRRVARVPGLFPDVRGFLGRLVPASGHYHTVQGVIVGRRGLSRQLGNDEIDDAGQEEAGCGQSARLPSRGRT